MSKLIHIRKPRIRISRKGVKIVKPSARIGGKTGVNVSRRGVSASARIPGATVSTRTGVTLGGRGFGGRRRKRKGCPLLMLTLALPLALAVGLSTCASASATRLEQVPLATEPPTAPPTKTLAPPVPTVTRKPPTATPTEPPVATTNCDPSYPTVCIAPPPPDLDCSDITFRKFKVLAPDPHQFDRDKNGIGCES